MPIGVRSVLALVAAVAALAASGCSVDDTGASGDFKPVTPDTLTVATPTVPIPGLWEGTVTHPTGGFEYGLAQALADRFGLKRVKVVQVPFQKIVGGDLGGADLSLALITPTQARREALDFSDSYFSAPPGVLTRSDQDVPDLETAQGLTWSVVRGTTLQDILDDQIDPDDPVVAVGSREDALARVVDKRVDATLFDLPLALAFANHSHGKLHVAAKLPEAEQDAAALPKDSDNVEAVSSAMRSFDADGTIDDLADKWLGSSAASEGDSVPLLRTTR